MNLLSMISTVSIMHEQKLVNKAMQTQLELQAGQVVSRTLISSVLVHFAALSSLTSNPLSSSPRMSLWDPSFRTLVCCLFRLAVFAALVSCPDVWLDSPNSCCQTYRHEVSQLLRLRFHPGQFQTWDYLCSQHPDRTHLQCLALRSQILMWQGLIDQVLSSSGLCLFHAWVTQFQTDSCRHSSLISACEFQKVLLYPNSLYFLPHRNWISQDQGILGLLGPRRFPCRSSYLWCRTFHL